ncbi:hypothetical protein [Paenibacillus odorifer]|uniref:hypothetical protein n=1 Tax=Paenibacillus odorifer TaxID=189426 RepID=UPI00096EAD7C|nr:hypothetical protein [Paenibacillus odorifer]OMD08376.1 hypothetical protein BJP50_07235 [Paenibacillus odorifer]
MSKLTEIKERVESFNADPNLYGVVMTVDEMNHLLSLLEEKDKALKEQHRYLERISVTFGEFECQRLAKEAMEKYTSSNNEGEN